MPCSLTPVRLLLSTRIPGVSAYAFCLFFSKLIAYTFLYWLPYYINSTPIEGRMLTPKEASHNIQCHRVVVVKGGVAFPNWLQAGDLSVLFDIGGVAGGVMAGHLSDKTGASALVATSFTMLSVPFLWLYRTYGHVSFSTNIALMMCSGFCVNGPYALITTAVSADLGTHESLQVEVAPPLQQLSDCVCGATCYRVPGRHPSDSLFACVCSTRDRVSSRRLSFSR